MKSTIGIVFVAFICLLSGCTATEKAAMKDCAKIVFPTQAVAVAQGAVGVCGNDADCIEKEARERAVIALSYFETCVDGRLDASGN